MIVAIILFVAIWGALAVSDTAGLHRSDFSSDVCRQRLPAVS
jgi:hypothetical protein